MISLPFKDNSFDKSVSITALEFVADAKSAIAELVRVTRPGGCIVVATLNSLSSWATRRREMTLKKPDHVLGHAFFRSPYELLNSSHLKGIAKSVIHFRKDDNPEEAMKVAAQYRHWICDEAMMAHAKQTAVYMHCLPADRGFEVTDAVIDGPQSRVYPEAENRMHTAKALMALTM